MSASTGGARRGLLIGISDYPYPHWKLDGCANDLELMLRSLTEKFGFPRENIEILRDEEATREGILAALEALVEATGPDDIVVIHYAGHGSQMTCREGDEPDGLDETLVPYDSGRGKDENRDITDDELHLFLRRLGEKTRYTTLIFDCCHSGTITRDAFGGKTRSVASDLRSVDELPRSPIHEPGILTRSTRNPGPSGWLSLSDRYVLIAGCAEEEQSAEKRVGDEAFGALTWYLSRELEKAGPGTTYRDVFEGMTGLVTANCSRQHPQMEGTLDRELFGVRDIEPSRYVRVVGNEDGVVTLAAGAAHGMTVGSVWDVVPPGTGEITEETQRLGEVEITSVGAVESRARPREGASSAIVAGARALETAHAYGDLRLACQLHVPEGSSESDRLRAALSASPLLVETDQDDAAVRIYALPPRPAPTAGGTDPVPQLGALEGGVLAAVGEQGELVVPVERREGRGGGGEEERALVGNLESLARYRQALGIENRNPDSRLRGAVTMTLFRKRPDGSLLPAEPESAGGRIVFEEGEEFVLEIESQHSEDVYFNLVDFDPAGAVTLVYPVRGANDRLAPGAKLPLPLRPSLPDKVPGASMADGGMLEGTEIFKLFVTTEPADFSFLEDRGFRSSGASGTGSPVELLMRTATGTATRGVELVVPTEGPDWSTVERTFVIRRGARPLEADGEPLELGSATILSRGVRGEAVSYPWRSERARASQLLDDRFGAALERSAVDVRSTVEIRGRQGDPIMRGAGIPEPSIELRLADPGSDLGQMVLASSEGGLLGWSFPEPGGDEGPAMRGAAEAPARRHRRFVIDASEEPAPDRPVTRGLVGAVGKKFLKELVFPLLDPVIGAVGDHFVGRFERARRPYRLRTFGPEDFRSAEATAIEGEGWRRLAEGPSLLLLHGTFSQSHTGFGSMSPDFVESLHRRYEGRVFAFDHHTLSDDPRSNAEWFLRQLPPDVELEVDLLCHARGGLVGRALAERQGELDGASRRLRVRRVVLAGAPNSGTELADPKHLGKLLDRYTNVLNLFDFLPVDTGVVEILESIISVAKQVALGTLKGLDGLRAMVPGGDFQKWLDQGRGMAETRYFALASDYRPSDPTLQRLLASKAARRVFPSGGNDLIVPTSGVYDRRRAPRGDAGEGGAHFPIADRYVFEGDALGHFDYFSHPEARARIESWLA